MLAKTWCVKKLDVGISWLSWERLLQPSSVILTQVEERETWRELSSDLHTCTPAAYCPSPNKCKESLFFQKSRCESVARGIG